MSTHEPHMPTRDEVVAGTSRPLPKWLKTLSIVLIIAGFIVWFIGVFESPDRAWRALLFNWLYFTSISSAAVMFVAVQRITTARWSRPVVRFAEGYVAFLPVSFVLLLLIFIGKSYIFPWALAKPEIHEKQIWLNPLFIIPRDIILFGVLAALQVYYIYTCVRLDVGVTAEGGAEWAQKIRERMRRAFRDERREIHSTHSLQGYLAVFMALSFAFFWIILSWDLSMSLDLHFQSTMYGWWFFMGGWVAAIASLTILTATWRRYLDRYDLITEKHFHDLGKLCFAFTAFWGYLTFGQYLVIWYGNMGEETHWMRLRLIAPWAKLTIFGVVLMFGPFFGLMARSAKVFLPTMMLFASFTVAGLWIHRYIEVYPSLYYQSPDIPFGIYEIGTAVWLLGMWTFCYTSFMDAFPRMRIVLMTSPYRDEVQVPVNPETMEPLPAHE